MEPANEATLLWMNELLATLIVRMAAAGILSEHGADALAEEVRAHAARKYPQHADRFLSAAAFLQTGIRENCDPSRNR